MIIIRLPEFSSSFRLHGRTETLCAPQQRAPYRVWPSWAVLTSIRGGSGARAKMVYPRYTRPIVADRRRLSLCSNNRQRGSGRTKAEQIMSYLLYITSR